MNITPKYFTSAIIGIAVFSLSFFVTCLAQEKSKEDTTKYEYEEVVVVGTRTVEKVIDIPYSVFRVDKKELTTGRKVSAKDVLADVPGLLLQSRYGNHDLKISIRGFGMRSNSGVRGVRILQDGIPESEPDGESVLDAIDFTSLGGVEVVKSNLSSLYANAPGGVINFISDLRFPENYTAVTSQVGMYGLRQNGIKTGYKTNDYRFLLSYNYLNLDGFRQHSAEYQHLLNAIYEGHPGTRSLITVTGNYVNGVNYIPGSLTAAEFAADPFQAHPLAVTQDFRRETKKGKIGIRFNTFFGENGERELEVTGYGGLKELENADNEVISMATRYTLGALVRFTSTFNVLDRPNILSVGMDYAAQSGPVMDFENLFGTRGFSVQNEYSGSLSNIGVYLLDHFKLLPDELDLFLSGRIDKNVFDREIFIPYGFLDSSRTFQKFAPKAGLNYKLTPSVALYTSYGLSFDFPALSELNNTPLSSNIKYSLNPDLHEQKSINIEFGIKGDSFNPESDVLRRVFFEATFFHYIINDEIVPFVINQTTYFRNAARTNRTGVEIGLKMEPFEGIEFVTNYTFTHFRYDAYNAMVYGPSGSAFETYSGNVVPSVPEHILALILNYEFGMTDNVSGLLQWDCDYVSSMFVNDANSESTPGYFYGNPMAGVSISYSRIHALAYAGVKNVFDRRYAGFININDSYGRYYEAGEPRNFYSGLNFSIQL